MPILEKIAISDFRNIEFQELCFSPNVNCIWGNNGEGKTNLLDAIYYLSMTKSAFSVTDRYNFRYGTEQFSVGGTYSMHNGLKSRFAIQVSKDEKKLKRDDKFYSRISSHIGVLPVVMVSPADISLVSEGGEERRKFVNGVLSQMDAEYLSDVQQYSRLLLQRNKMLKDACPDATLLEVMDSRMSVYASRIYESRKTFARSLLPLVSDIYSRLSSDREEIGISYESDLSSGRLEELFLSRRERDMALKYTTAGVQRDDFNFTINGYPLRRCGSQGQQKSFLVSLKFAQYELMKRRYGYAPILLLDDVFDKLDADRIAQLLSIVSGDSFGQIFITDCNRDRLRGIVDGLTEQRSYFKAEKGVFTLM